MANKSMLSIACALVAIVIGSYVLRDRQSSKGRAVVVDQNDEKTDRSRRMTRFVEWFERHGGKMHSALEFLYTEDYGYALGIRPSLNHNGDKTVVKEGTKLLEIPSSLHITPDRARAIVWQRRRAQEGPAGLAKEQHGLSVLSDQAILACFLMLHHCQAFSEREHSFFAPYIDILMETLDAYQSDTVPVLASFSND
ncbi:hypothetical protein ACA910_002388 [Epithemia clementina (nom. ined.)]